MRPSQPSRKPRSRAKNGPAFVFVDAPNNRSGKPHDEVSRAQIRRQAARSGRKSQRIQTWDSGDGSDTPEDLELELELESEPALLQLVQVRGSPMLTTQPSFSGYEALRVKYNFDITYLASFTDVDLGKTASLFLHEHENGRAAHLTRLLQQQSSSSFLSYLPSRYGASAVLDDAMHCLAARAGQIFGFSVSAGTISALYARALKSLQGALTDNGLCLGADVYCATRLLTLYELIGLPGANHWVLHNRGGIKLVELRGPDNHTTRFDWMLLKSQGPSILVDELYRRKTSIFEAPAWQHLFNYASRCEPDPDMSLWWEIFSSISFVTGIMKNMSDLFQHPLPDGHSHTEAHHELKTDTLDRAQSIHRRLHEIRARSQETGSPSLSDLPLTPESPDRIRLRGFFLYSLMQICRALATISKTATSRATAEEEAQALAAQALLIQYATTDLDPAMSWHFGQRNALAESIVGTRAEWISEADFGSLKGDYYEEERERERFLGARWLAWYEAWMNQYLSVALES